jgi:hypothetical protein
MTQVVVMMPGEVYIPEGAAIQTREHVFDKRKRERKEGENGRRK